MALTEINCDRFHLKRPLIQDARVEIDQLMPPSAAEEHKR